MKYFNKVMKKLKKVIPKIGLLSASEAIEIPNSGK